uniref:Uncharacterized protein n=1 Tax=Anguilla anguilla TaxID=7936 RepID=A0A0E9XJY6_ANGAN
MVQAAFIFSNCHKNYNKRLTHVNFHLKKGPLIKIHVEQVI